MGALMFVLAGRFLGDGMVGPDLSMGVGIGAAHDQPPVLKNLYVVDKIAGAEAEILLDPGVNDRQHLILSHPRQTQVMLRGIADNPADALLGFADNQTFGVAFGSGDNNRRDGVDRNYRQSGLQDNNARFAGVTSFKFYGETVEPELSNLLIGTAAIGVRPTPRSSVDLVYHYYAQHRAD